MANLKKEFKTVSLNKSVKNLTKETKDKAKGIFALHHLVTGLLKTENRQVFEGFNLMVNDKISPIVKELKKEIKPFHLFYGLSTLDKTLKAYQSKDFLSFVDLYASFTLTYLSKDKDERELILMRGEAINKIMLDFKSEKIKGYEFIKQLFEFYPSFYENLKKGKIAPNVAMFIFDNDAELYDTLNLSELHDVVLITIRSNVKKLHGAIGLESFDNELKQGAKLETLQSRYLSGAKLETPGKVETIATIEAAAN